jgi:hypothetical protein
MALLHTVAMQFRDGTYAFTDVLHRVLYHTRSDERRNALMLWLDRNALHLDVAKLMRKDRLETKSGGDRPRRVREDASQHCFMPYFAPASPAVRQCSCVASAALECRVLRSSSSSTEKEATIGMPAPLRVLNLTAASSPLSTRERNFLTGAGATVQPDDAQPWHSNSQPYRFANAAAGGGASSAYVREAHRLRIQSLSGPASTMDVIIQLANYVGMQRPEELALLRLAGIAWLVPTMQHSVHEVLQGAMGHGVSGSDAVMHGVPYKYTVQRPCLGADGGTSSWSAAYDPAVFARLFPFGAGTTFVDDASVAHAVSQDSWHAALLEQLSAAFPNQVADGTAEDNADAVITRIASHALRLH